MSTASVVVIEVAVGAQVGLDRLVSQYSLSVSVSEFVPLLAVHVIVTVPGDASTGGLHVTLSPVPVTLPWVALHSKSSAGTSVVTVILLSGSPPPVKWVVCLSSAP